jgi:MFS family permease
LTRRRDPPRIPLVRSHHNALALGADYALFLVGLSLISHHTILPAFARHLGAPNVVIGAIPATMTAGWLLPSLFAAGHTESLPRKLPFVLRWTAVERLPPLLLAVVALTVAPSAPGVAVGLMLLLLLVLCGIGGVLMPAWMDIVARVVPTTVRGRFFGISSLLAGLGGLAGSAGTAWVLARWEAPTSFAICFLAAFVCFVASFGAFVLVREPEPAAAPTPAVPLGEYLRRVPGLVRRDANLARYLVARAVITVGAMASGFFAVFALNAWEASDRWAAVYTAAFLAGQIVANLALGWLADLAGHRLVLLIGATAMLGANVAALLAASLPAFGVVLALSGIYQAAVSLSGHNVLIEFAPTPGERPTYVGLGTTAQAPVTVAAPLAAGVLADGLGFPLVFGLAAAGSLAGLVLLGAFVRDPRHGT